jgi:hypothetical protein
VNIVRKKENYFREVSEMKKLILVLAIALMASPAFALNVYLHRVPDTNVIDVNYSDANATNLPRAFALEITIPSGSAKVSSVINYKANGESTVAGKGYGIYPAMIDINSFGIVQTWGTPLADTIHDPGAGIALPSQDVVLEFASLYYDAPGAAESNAPATSGKLCSLKIGLNGQLTTFNVKMKGETTFRGGVVLEDGTQFPVDTNTLYVIPVLLPGKAGLVSPTPSGTTGVARIGTSLTWTAGTGTVNSHGVYFGTVSPGTYLGTQTGASYAIPGTMAQGKLYYWRIDENNSAGTTTGDQWSFRVQECMKSTSTEYNRWVTYGRPDCWCYKKQCRGDADGKLTSLKPIMTPDLNVFKGGFNKAGSVIRDLMVGTVQAICADFDRKDTSLKPVMTPDLNIFKAWFNKANTIVPQCDAAPIVGQYNFWMN